MPARSDRLLAVVVATFAVGCVGRSGPEPEVPDLLADEDPKELFPELEAQTIRRLHATLAQVEHLHRSQKPEPCARAWEDLEVLMAAGRPVQAESARFFNACGCCLKTEEDDDDGAGEPGAGRAGLGSD